jgi:hypothetical protein
MCTEWDGQRSGSNVSWGKISPSEHHMQIYGHEDVFLDALEGFVSGGLRAGEEVVVIATAAHRTALEERLTAQGFDLEAARRQEQYLPVDAEETIAQFLVKGWPDDALFVQLVTELLARAHRYGRRVRVFGEMVALLGAHGHNGTTGRLEHLWQRLCKQGNPSSEKVTAISMSSTPGNSEFWSF